MPKVPTFNGPQIEERALPGVRDASAASAKLLSGGQGFAEAGEALQRVGGEAAKIMGEIQDRTNVDAVFRAETLFREDALKFETAQREKRGAVALADGGVTEQTEKWFSETVLKHSGALSNPAQQRAFDQTAQRLRLQTIGTISTHQANEARASVTDSANATIVAAINRAAAHPNDWTVVDSERGEIAKRVRVLGQLNGHDAETQSVALGNKLTMLHKQVIESLVKSNPAAVKAYYEKYENEIDGQHRAEIGAYAAKATAVSVGDGVADAVWKSDGPKSRTDPVTLATMEERLRTELKGNDEAIKVGIAGIRERAAAYRDQRKEEANALEAGVNTLILQGASGAQLRKSPAYLQLATSAPEEARKIDAFIENRDYTRVARAAASEQRQEAAERRAETRLHRDTLDVALRVSDPAALAGMSRDQVVNLLPKLGATSTQALLAKYDSFAKNPEKLVEARIDKQDFDVMALRAGFRPNESHKSEAQKDQLVRLQAQVENVIDAEQRKTGKALPREAKRVLMQREVDNVAMLGAWSPDKRIVGTLSDDEMKQAYVLAGPKAEKIMLSDIPPTFRVRAITARKAQGLETTEQQMAELWARSPGYKPGGRFRDVDRALLPVVKLLSDADVGGIAARAVNPLAPLAEAAIPGKKGRALGAMLDGERLEQRLKENDAEQAGK